MTNYIYNLINCQEVLDYVNDLEKQVAEKDKEINKLKDTLKDLKEEISECYVDGQDYVELREQKDKEIDKLTRRLSLTTKYKDDQKERANKYYDEIKQIRKQVCDEIREELYYDNEYTWSSIKAVLDKIEEE